MSVRSWLVGVIAEALKKERDARSTTLTKYYDGRLKTSVSDYLEGMAAAKVRTARIAEDFAGRISGAKRVDVLREGKKGSPEARVDGLSSGLAPLIRIVIVSDRDLKHGSPEIVVDLVNGIARCAHDSSPSVGGVDSPTVGDPSAGGEA